MDLRLHAILLDITNLAQSAYGLHRRALHGVRGLLIKQVRVYQNIPGVPGVNHTVVGDDDRRSWDNRGSVGEMYHQGVEA